MIRILSDRIAEAAAEYLHELIAKKFWVMQMMKILALKIFSGSGTKESDRHRVIRPVPITPKNVLSLTFWMQKDWPEQD